MSIALALLAACGDDSPAPATVLIGSVIDGATEEPLPGAEVQVAFGAEVEANVLTDEAGRFQLQFPAPAGPGSQSLE
ncbi:hypothetical protein, partial [Dokdonella sp.]|uniref:hypothetical protein n=1 Tax=Dokdonella sp. TaxID=2291710 RepID=UPI003C6F6622